ncbi:MAG: hypothetical protein IPM57_09670 [Oligoflexia bacterium]|nr:hypothetical protein [Oligoflexia bacterium]
MKIFLIILFCATSSWAQEQSKPKVIYKKSETHKFSGLKLKGQFKKPELSYIYQRKGIRFEQIVDVPENFNQQIIHSSSEF